MENELINIAEDILKLSDTSVDIVIFYNHYLFRRYANSFIHQSTLEKTYLIGVRLRYDNKFSVFWTNSRDKEHLSYLIKTAKKSLKESNYILPMTKKQIADYEYAYDEYEIVSDTTSKIIKDIIYIGKDYRSFGNLYTGFQHILLFSSDGFSAYNKVSINNLTINYMNKTSAWSQYSSYKFSDILENYESIAKDCLEKLKLSENISEIEPGKYDVILTSLAFSDILEIINYYALSGINYYEGLSPFSGKIGKRIFSERFNLYDEPLNKGLLPIGFDLEGNIKANIPVIENGILKNVALNNKYAKLLNLENTACAFSFSSDFAIFSHLHLKGGNKPLKKIIEDTERGVLVNRIWYVNLVEPTSLTITGMTRDGLFLIEDGKLKSGLRNMRFNQSFIDALNSEVELSSDEKLIVNSNFYEFFPKGMILPDIKIPNFYFISKTEF
ncbi:MAG: TldD/PmbA family protein [candidate division WOR-3 bacterium]|nr:TldD/PmbA family protein [candidate division WOR-3 bacterium]MCX7947668.1 TldD/PmbA family protein [candidate division WOR-3 bacterium]MDW8150545.1 TldD/PmbA family protein [candidate division WOR-3 bacterium]